jgi:hypothetical protein
MLVMTNWSMRVSLSVRMNWSMRVWDLSWLIMLFMVVLIKILISVAGLAGSVCIVLLLVAIIFLVWAKLLLSEGGELLLGHRGSAS